MNNNKQIKKDGKWWGEELYSKTSIRRRYKYHCNSNRFLAHLISKMKYKSMKTNKQYTWNV